MALIARHAIPNRPAVPLPPLRRPSLRALAATAAIAFLVLLIDAMVNPRAFFDLSAMRRLQAVTFPGLPELARGVDVLTGSSGALTAWVVALVAFTILRWWVPAMTAAALPIGGAINLFVGEVLVARTRPHLPELVR